MQELEKRHERRQYVREIKLPTACKESISEGIVQGLGKIVNDTLTDREKLRGFWKAGFDEFLDHGKAKSAQWIGTKILSWLATSMLAGSMIIAAYLWGRSK